MKADRSRSTTHLAVAGSALEWLAPVSLLVVYFLFVILYLAGGENYYLIGSKFIISFLSEPFLDTHAVLAALECHARGIDTFTDNPCDMWNRPHVYSPLWLALAGTGITTGQTLITGFLLGMAFIGSVCLLPCAKGKRAALLTVAATLSPGILLALERGNNDLVVFIVAVLAIRASTAGGGWHILGYMMTIIAGLLKFYPATLLILTTRETLSRAMLSVLLAIAIFGIYGWMEAEHLGQILRSIPQAEPLGTSLGIRNLSDGMHLLAPRWAVVRFGLVGLVLLVCLVTLGCLITDSRLSDRFAVLTSLEAMFFLGGSAIFVGCFLTASSHAYRSIYLLLIVPGLLRMGRGYWPITVAGFLATLLPWAWLLPISRSGVRFGLSDWLGWFSIQALWWWLVTVLSALLIVGVSRSQAGTMLLARLGIKRFGAMV